MLLAAKNTNTSNSNGHTTSDARDLTADDIASRLELKTNIYRVDSSGKRLLSHTLENREYQMSGNKKANFMNINWKWRFNNEPVISVSHNWVVQPDGTIEVTIRKYSSLEFENDEVKYGKLLEEKKMTLTNFEPISLLFEDKRGQKFVAQIVPSLADNREPEDLAGFPISLDEASIMDNTGRAWAKNIGATGRYLRITTHVGTVVVSLKPFAGAKEIGTVKGNILTVQANPNYSIELISLNPIVSKRVLGKVYGMLDEGKRTPKFGSVAIASSDSESDFLTHL